MRIRHQEQQSGQHRDLTQENARPHGDVGRREASPPAERGTSQAPAERGTARPPAPNREGPGPGLPIAIILAIVVIFVLIFAVVLV